MKVLVISTMYPNSQVYKSGVFVHESVKELKKLGVDITVIAPVPYSPYLFRNFNDRWMKFSKVPFFENMDNVEIFHPRFIALPRGLFKSYWGWVIFYQILNLINKRKIQIPDIIHVHGSLPEDHAGFLLKKKLNRKMILTVHGASVYAVVKRKWQFRTTKRILRNSDLVVGVSETVRERIKLLTGREENIEVIYNGYKPVKFDYVSKPQNSKIKILFGATLVERKGCEYVIRAFKKIQGYKDRIELEIAGGGELLEKLKHLTEELNISNLVKFYGVVSHEKMLSLMQECDIFVLPSWDEAFGVVYLEAMSFGKPIIGTVNEGISEIIKNGENGLLVQPRNIDDLVEKIKNLIENKDLREKIGEAGLNTVKTMTWKTNAQKYKLLYEQMMKDDEI